MRRLSFEFTQTNSPHRQDSDDFLCERLLNFGTLRIATRSCKNRSSIAFSHLLSVPLINESDNLNVATGAGLEVGHWLPF